MSIALSEQDTRNNSNSGPAFDNHNNMEQLTSPHAPSTRHLMHESNGLPPSAYTSNPDFAGGSNLGRQFSIQLTPEQFEKLYLQPGKRCHVHMSLFDELTSVLRNVPQVEWVLHDKRISRSDCVSYSNDAMEGGLC